MQDFEKIGAFYLGRLFDQSSGDIQQDILLYDAKDLTTHAVCVGMTGSGKTGLGVCLLEEALIDGIPALVIDPKGDLANLLLTFPNLDAAEFEPWVDEGEALRKGMNKQQYSKKIAATWRSGLEKWGQLPERISRLRSACEMSIYTPGSSAGLQLTVLRSLAAPAAELMADGDALRERILATVSGLLGLLGLQADPIQSREHILISRLLETAWREGRDMEIATLIGEIQSPTFDRIGVVDLESFFPTSERFGLSMRFNNLLASPAFSAWMDGDPLDINRLLWTPGGKPRLTILSIAHLSDSERMFFVTMVLSEVIGWMRQQQGTSSLRALLYMDEIFGFFPPTANPPSKMPMLTLLKQARAYGLGCVLATQNPVDLDYKGLSNAGTWFIGRLLTERDKMRVLEGLEGASVAANEGFDRQRMEETLAGIKSRVFLMNNVHDDRPVLFHTRWAMSYLRGPLTRNQIQKLMQPAKEARQDELQPVAVKKNKIPTLTAAPTKEEEQGAPTLAKEISQKYLHTRGLVDDDALLYRPSLYGQARLHYSSSRNRVDFWQNISLLTALAEEDITDPWVNAESPSADELELHRRSNFPGRFAALPKAARKKRQYGLWTKRLRSYLYRTQTIKIWKCPAVAEFSRPEETKGDFRIRLTQIVHEKRDLEVEKIRQRYAPKLARVEEVIRKAQQKVEREGSQYDSQKWQAALSVGASLLGSLLGRKIGGYSRSGSAVRGVSRIARERKDYTHAIETLEAQKEKLEGLQQEFQDAMDKVKESLDVQHLDFDEVSIRPLKTGIDILDVCLVWAPWQVDEDGIAEPAY